MTRITKVARAFTREGARVFLAGRTQAKLDQVADEFRSNGGAAETAVMNALDEQSVDKFVDGVVAKAGQITSRELFEAVRQVVEAIGPAEIRVTRSQVAFWHSRAFAGVWMPEQYLRRNAAPLVLTLGFRSRDPSPRWKSIVEPVPGRFTHHLELYSGADIDEEVRRWLHQAWEAAG